MAVRLEPDLPEARIQYGRHLLFRGRTAEGLQQFQAARSADPASAIVLSWVAYAYYLLGQQDSANVIVDKAVHSSGAVNTLTPGIVAAIRARDGRYREALEQKHMLAATYVLAANGDSSAVRTLLDTMPQMPFIWRAFVMLGLRDSAGALRALERATDAGDNWTSIYATNDPMFASVRGTRRFEALLRRVGLDPAQLGALANTRR